MKHIKAKAIIFDYNGTLVDDSVVGWQTSMAMVKQFKGKPMSYLAMRDILLGRTGSARPSWLGMYRACGLTVDEREIAEYYYGICADIRKSVELFPDALDTLNTLHERGFALGIVSGFERRVIMEELDRFGLIRLFPPHLVYANRGAIKFQKEETTRQILGTLHVCGTSAVTVGDMPFEMRAAISLGMRAIGFLGGLGTRSSLLAAGAEHCIRRLKTLQQILRRS